MVLNLILAADWISQAHKKPPPPKKAPLARRFNPFETHFKTNVVVRRQNFTWHEVESGDFSIYIKNLREIGCPEATIRDIIVADVDELFAHRRALEIISPAHQWWRSGPDLELTQKVAEKTRNLEAEKKILLTRLLGPGWETAGEHPVVRSRDGINLDGPVLGELSPEKKQAVFDISDQAEGAIAVLQNKARENGQALNPTDLARIRQQSRLELGKVLTPAQLEEFLLRYSDTANQMREEFRGLNPTPEVFRAAFHARDSLAQQLEILPDTPENSKVRSDLAAQLRGAVRQSLGEERYELLKNNQDPLFRQARDLAAQAGAPPNVVAPIYQISQAVAAEQKRIANDATLSDEEKIAALASAQREKARSLEQLLGTETYRRFLLGQSSK